MIVVAEGAGQEHLARQDATDASGNRRLSDIGLFLRDHLKSALKDLGGNLKYIDPSYLIRAAPATPGDAIFCGRLAENAVHAAMGGKTGLMVGLWANRVVHLPLTTVIESEKRLDLDGALWRSVVDATAQPAIFAISRF